MVGKKPTLRNFLKKEIAKDKRKIKVPDDPHSPQSPKTPNNITPSSSTQGRLSSLGNRSPLNTSHTTNPKAYNTSSTNPSQPSASRGLLFASATNPSAGIANVEDETETNSLFGDDVDSLFGDPLDMPSVKEQERQAKLDQLLAQGTPQAEPIARFTESFDLRDMKEELKKLVFYETGGTLTGREQTLVERQKGSLIEEIRYLGEVERRAYEDQITSNMQFPEPIGHFEKQKMERDMLRLERSRAQAAEGPPKPKRTRRQIQEERDNDNALDGEERHRLGKSLKTKPLATTGHFRSTTHDYFPGIPGAKKVFTESGVEVTLEPTLQNFSPEERKLRRRELADMGERLAKADRRKKGFSRL